MSTIFWVLFIIFALIAIIGLVWISYDIGYDEGWKDHANGKVKRHSNKKEST